MILDRFNQLVNLVEDCRNDAEKCNSGNKSAGTRLRKQYTEIAKFVKILRKEVLDKKENVL